MSSVSVQSVDFEPTLLDGAVYNSRHRHARVDVAVLLSVMLCLLYLMPGRLIVPNLTYAGRPALLLAMALLAWWVLARLNPWLVLVGPQPIRWAVLFFLASLLMSYIAGLLRGLLTIEQNAQNFGMLQSLEMIGVILVAADGLPNWERMRRVIRVLVWCAAFSALTAVYMSYAHRDIAAFYPIPGLELKGGIVGFEDRGVGTRVAGTATHYIEFSATMAMAIPFAIHVARFSISKRHRTWAVVAGALCFMAIPLSVSRTGVVALAAALLVMIPAWNWRLRYNLLVVWGAAMAAMFVVKPGLLGTVMNMFTKASDDPSVSGRTQDYEIVGRLFGERPWLGLGPSTLVPEIYQRLVLDNQWLYTLVTLGLVGVVALAALHITCIRLAWLARRRSASEEQKHLCTALIATQVICILVEGTVDAFYYTTYSITMALLMGSCGAVWRFTHPARTVRTSSPRRFLSFQQLHRTPAAEEAL